jgi:hypothetical protein
MNKTTSLPRSESQKEERAERGQSIDQSTMMRPDIQSGAAAATVVGTQAPGKTTTIVEQGRAIVRAAQRAVDGGAGVLSLKKSLERFLEGRENKLRRRPRRRREIQRCHLDESFYDVCATVCVFFQAVGWWRVLEFCVNSLHL